MSEEQKSRWVWYLIIPIVVVAVLLVAMFGGSFFYLRDSMREFEAADRSYEDLKQAHGPAGAYVPASALEIPADRIEAFLAAREELFGLRGALSASLCALSEGAVGVDCGDPSAVAKALAAFRLTGQLAGYHEARNVALERHGIGLGEYGYLCVLAYHSWLGKSLANGPSFEIVGRRGYFLETIASGDPAEIGALRERRARATIRMLMLGALRGRLAKLEALEGSDADVERALLAEEVEALESDPERLSWADGLPQSLARALSPYRERLERSYDPMTAAIDIGLLRREFEGDDPPTPTEEIADVE